MGTVTSSSNVQMGVIGLKPKAPHEKEAELAESIPQDVVEAIESVFLTRREDLLRALMQYYSISPGEKAKVIHKVYRLMIGVDFEPESGEARSQLPNEYGVTGNGLIVEHNTLQLVKQINAGTYGDIWQAKLNGVPIIVKTGSGPQQVSLLEEAILSILMGSPRMQACFEYYMKKFGVTGIDRYPFVEVGFIVRNNSLRKRRLLMGMENLQYSIMEFVARPELRCSEADFADILAQVLQVLYVAQEAFAFQHKDFKANNVMLIERSEPKTIERGIRGAKPAAFRSRFHVVFIDLGMSCTNLAGCGAPIFIENVNQVFRQAGVRCDNPSQDLMMFFISLIPYMGDMIMRNPGSRRFVSWWNAFLLPVEHLANQMDIRDVRHDTYQHLYNDQVLARAKSREVTPSKMFRRLLDIVHRLNGEEEAGGGRGQAERRDLRLGRGGRGHQAAYTHSPRQREKHFRPGRWGQYQTP